MHVYCRITTYYDYDYEYFALFEEKVLDTYL